MFPLDPCDLTPTVTGDAALKVLGVELHAKLNAAAHHCEKYELASVTSCC